MSPQQYFSHRRRYKESGCDTLALYVPSVKHWYTRSPLTTAWLNQRWASWLFAMYPSCWRTQNLMSTWWSSSPRRGHHYRGGIVQEPKCHSHCINWTKITLLTCTSIFCSDVNDRVLFVSNAHSLNNFGHICGVDCLLACWVLTKYHTNCGPFYRLRAGVLWRLSPSSQIDEALSYVTPSVVSTSHLRVHI